MIEVLIFLALVLIALFIIGKNNNFSIKAWFSQRKSDEIEEIEAEVVKDGYSFEESIKKFGHLPYTKNEGGQFTEEVVTHTRNNRK